MIYILLLITAFCSAIIDAVIYQNPFAKWGLWWSNEGWKSKYVLTQWFNQFLPLWLSKFLAQDVFVIFSDLIHTAKTIMVACFMIAIFGFTWTAFIFWFVWGIVFNMFYYTIR